MAQGRSTKDISIIEWTRTRRLSIRKSLSVGCEQVLMDQDVGLTGGGLGGVRAYKAITPPTNRATKGLFVGI